MTKPVEAHVVTCFLRNRGEVLLLRRSDAVGSYPGKWGGVAGYVEDGPERAALREIAEETGLTDGVTLVRAGEPFPVEDETLRKRWIVHPFLFDCDRRELTLDWESTDAEWVSPTEILRRDTVPELWTSYTHVAPTVETVVNDVEHGSAYLSLRALEVLRDRAAMLVKERVAFRIAWTELVATATRILRDRPAMAVLSNRVNRVMHRARETRSIEKVQAIAASAIEQALADDDEAARRAARYVAGRRVVTLSRSGTVMQALTTAQPRPSAVAVMESRPGSEGASVAEVLALNGLSVTLLPDAAIAALLAEREFDLVMVGADRLFPSGDVLNKVGSRVAALAARQASIPFYAVSATDKLQGKEGALPWEWGSFEELYRGEAPLRPFVPIFEVIPAELVTELVTERGVLTPSDLQSLSSALEELTDWRRDTD